MTTYTLAPLSIFHSIMTAPVIEIDSGRIRGTTEDNINGGTFIAFKGIPYAKSPIGDLRFRDPVPVEPWTGIKDATKFGDACYQYNKCPEEFIGSEDCLYLNVYVPTLNPPTPSAVMIWIHGGAFVTGSGDDEVYSVDYLVEKDVVIVTINYRLGCLGFLNLEHEVAPGNQGLKDQVLALKWVQRNISKFGGDPNNVTIGGQSAGAASVHFLALSPMGRGLFQKAILQSGVAINPWTQVVSPTENAVKLTAVLGNEISIPEKIVEYLRTVEVHRLIEAQQQVLTPDEDLKLILPFVPGCDSISDEPFLPISLEEAAKVGIQVPCIIGHTTEESLYFADFAKEIIGKNGEYVLHPIVIEDFKRRDFSIQKILRHYLGGETITSENISGYINLTSDTLQIADIHETLVIQKEAPPAPTYYYKFSFHSEKTLMKARMRTKLPGACHTDDLSFLFHHKVLEKMGKEPLILDPVHETIIRRFTEMLTNFIKTGNPTPETSDLIPVIWKPIDNSEGLRCLQISDTLQMDVEKYYYDYLAQKIGI